MAAAAAISVSAQVKTVAHRGYWTADGSAQNSLRALVKADSIGCYASEFDVWLSTDNVPVVNHDEVFKGVRMQDAAAAVCTAVVLPNGENLPTLAAYLDLAATLPDLRLVLELKAHEKREREQKAARMCVDMVAERGLQPRTDYITFSRDAMMDFIASAPQAKVYYLTGDMTPAQLKEAGAAGLDYHISVFKSHPEWIREAHDLDLEVNVWTVNEADDMQWCIDNGVDYITTNNPELLLSLTEK